MIKCTIKYNQPVQFIEQIPLAEVGRDEISIGGGIRDTSAWLRVIMSLQI